MVPRQDRSYDVLQQSRELGRLRCSPRELNTLGQIGVFLRACPAIPITTIVAVGLENLATWRVHPVILLAGKSLGPLAL